MNGERHRLKGANLITFQFKLNETVSLHNGQSMGSAVRRRGRRHESEVYYSAPITCHYAIVGSCLSIEESTLK